VNENTGKSTQSIEGRFPMTLLDSRYFPAESSSTVRSQPGLWRPHTAADLSSPVPYRSSLIPIFHRMQNLLDDAVQDRPLIGPLTSMSALRAEYGGSKSFLDQIDYLISQGYVSIRRARGDGDCFYRCELEPSTPIRLGHHRCVIFLVDHSSQLLRSGSSNNF